MTPTELDRLEAIAKKATPGEWRHIPGDSWCAFSHVVCGNKTHIFEDHDGHDPGECRKDGECGMPDDQADSAYISAFNPQTALKLIGDLRKAMELLNISREQLKFHEDSCNLGIYAGASIARIDSLMGELNYTKGGGE